MNRYESNLKNSSPVIDDLRNEYARMPRGVHDLTYRANFDASDGWIIPIDYHELVPNSDLYLSYDVGLLSHNPTFRRLLSGASIELRTYKRLKSDSWKGWNNFITKGRTGKVTKSLPYVDFNLHTMSEDSTSSYARTTLTPHSPACYLGFVPPVFLGVNDTNYSNFVKSSYPQRIASHIKSNPPFNISNFTTGLTGITSMQQIYDSTALRINALPLVMYNSVVKEFLDLNLLIDESQGSYSSWCPENEDDDMILPYSASGAISTSNFYNPTAGLGTINPDISLTSQPYLNVLYRANKPGDIFDTGSPFPDLIRGDTPILSVLNSEITGSVSGSADFSEVVTGIGYGQTLAMLGYDVNSKSLGGLSQLMNDSDKTFLNVDALGDIYNTNASGAVGNLYTIDNNNLNSALLATLNKAKFNGQIDSATVNAINFSMNQWRYLATMTVFAERMARTDGSYNELIEAQFGHNPRWHGHRPSFCGGSRQPLVFSEVVQQSASNTNGTPLGTTAGRSVSSSQNGSISIHTDDFCDVLTVMVIRPDEYYCQGVDKRVSRLENIEQYFPIFNNLAPDATLNKELFVSGTNDTDEDVFNYQERFAYFKSLRNRVSGLLALPSSVVGSIGQYVKHRIFTQTPNFNIGFVQESEDTNMKSVYTSSVESEYVISVGVSAKLVAPIPEVTVPSDMGISY